MATAQERTLRFAHHLPGGLEQHIAAERFAAEVSELTGDALTVELLPDGQMSGEREIIESVPIGTLDVGCGESGLYPINVRAFGILSLTHLYTNQAH